MIAGPLCHLGVSVPGANGAALATDVYLPDATPAPTLLVQTPSSRGALAWEAAQWAELGYACVIQEQRSSQPEGNGAAATSEALDGAVADGQAVLSWIGTQAWADGRVVPYGTGRGAALAIAAARSDHPSVLGVVVVAPGSASTRPASGLPLLEWPLWSALNDRVGGPDAVAPLDVLQARDPALLEQLPVTAIVDRVGLPSEVLRANGGGGAAVLDAARALSVPSLHVGSWYDPLVEHAMTLHDAAGSDARPAPPRTQVIGPWAFPEHVRLAADCDLEFAGADERPPQAEIALWLERLLAGEELPPSRWFETGTNIWIETGIDQPACSEPDTEWHATSDGGLQREAPSGAARVAFESDPRSPHPSLPHSADHAPLTERADAVGFTTAPLEAPLGWGRARVELRATSSALTTDWIAQLLRVLPDGRAHRLGLAGTEAAGDASCHRLDFPPHAVRLNAGERLRLLISSASFPYVARNLQSGESRWGGTECAKAEQQVAVGATGTRLILGGGS